MMWLYALLGLIVGTVLGYLLFRTRQMGTSMSENQALAKQLLEKEEQMESMRSEHLANAKEIATKEEQVRQLEKKLQEQQGDLDQVRQEFKREFQLIATKILDENSQKFSQQHQTGLDSVLSPLKEKIKEFETKVENTYRHDTTERAKLKAELENLLKLNQQLSSDAKNLATALKGESKTQGNWGEMVLQKILESSGLTEGIEFTTQESVTNSEGKRVLPDVVVHLPDNKHIIIDSKVSLTAYEKMVNEEEPSMRQSYLTEHLNSIRSHIKGLSEKGYEALPELQSPDFVLLFIPIESSFGVAVAEDQQLYDFAWSKKVVIVTPSTLLATLRTISSVWKQERQQKNVLEIARLAGTLYDKFVSFTGDMDRIENRLNQASQAYEDAKKKLSEGRGSMVKTALKTKELGVKSKKEFTEQWTNDTLEELQEKDHHE